MSSQPVYFDHASVFHHQGKPVPLELSIATVSSDGCDPQVMGITLNHAGLKSTPHELRSNSHEYERLRLLPPFTQECTRGIPILLHEGQVEPDGSRRPHGSKRNKTTKIFPRAGSVCHVPGDAALIQRHLRRNLSQLLAC
ncbi:hypothetical protein TNCV_286251 [Trichonephila clavipes]|nr:hypothetical protein TNCV_286251 [Trichonephila clavipes]